jgi:hypothetical protein
LRYFNQLSVNMHGQNLASHIRCHRIKKVGKALQHSKRPYQANDTESKSQVPNN